MPTTTTRGDELRAEAASEIEDARTFLAKAQRLTDVSTDWYLAASARSSSPRVGVVMGMSVAPFGAVVDCMGGTLSHRPAARRAVTTDYLLP